MYFLGDQKLFSAERGVTHFEGQKVPKNDGLELGFLLNSCRSKIVLSSDIGPLKSLNIERGRNLANIIM